MVEFAAHPHGSNAGATGPLYMLLFPVPVVCFVAALVTDITYAGTEFLMWLHFSEWSIAAGLAFGALAALVLLIRFIVDHNIRRGASGWVHLVLFYAALLVELFNAFVHTIDGWTAVVPTGMILSAIGAVLALAAAGTLFFVSATPVAHLERRR